MVRIRRQGRRQHERPLLSVFPAHSMLGSRVGFFFCVMSGTDLEDLGIHSHLSLMSSAFLFPIVRRKLFSWQGGTFRLLTIPKLTRVSCVVWSLCSTPGGPEHLQCFTSGGSRALTMITLCSTASLTILPFPE